MKKKVVLTRVLPSVIILLVLARIALPYAALRYVNNTLNNLEGFDGQIKDLDIALIRGAFTIQKVDIVKTGAKVPAPLFSADRVDISLLWSALFRGSVVSEVVFDKPVINIVDSNKSADAQTGADQSWTEVLQSVVPFNVERLTMNDGEFHFRNFNSSPPVDVYLENIDLQATNLTNSRDLGDTLVARVDATAQLMADAPAKLQLRMDPYAKQPLFDFNLQVAKLPVLKLDDLIKAYAPFDLEGGTISLTSELAARDGAIEGYVTPALEKADVFEWREDIERDDGNFLTIIGESLVTTFSAIFEEGSDDRIATRVPVNGRMDDPSIGVFSAVVGILRNAFIEEYSSALEDSVSLKDIGDDEKQDSAEDESKKK